MYGIMFHHFCDNFHPKSQGAISAQEFEDMIRFLQRRRSILAASDWMERALQGKLKPREICLTFDENLRCQYELALPVIRHYGITAFWFIYTSVFSGEVERLEVYRYFRTVCFTTIDAFYSAFFDTVKESPYGGEVRKALSFFSPSRYLQEFLFYTDDDRKFRFVRDRVLGVDGYNALMDSMIDTAQFNIGEAAKQLWMDADCLRTLSAEGHVLGLHSHTHPMAMGSLPEEDQLREYETNYLNLQAITQQKPRAMSHPCNSYNESTLAVLRKLGVELGFRSNMVEHPNQFSLEFPREDHANVLREMNEGLSRVS
jgi:peptidoglycan/xylan/chitin deacetylase (PgdA/CDA1 family)